MTRRPSRFWISIKSPIIERLKRAPERVRRTFYEMLTELEHGAYPDQCPFVAEAKGTDLNHCYVAWKDGVSIFYRITQDQPVIIIVGVHWRSGPEGDRDGEPEPELDWTLAA